MIQKESKLVVADNTGAKSLLVFGILGGSKRRYARAGDIVIASVTEADPTANVKKKSIVKALIIRTRCGENRKDGTRVEFEDNAAIIVNDKKEPIGKRVFGPVSRSVSRKNFGRVYSLATEVI